MDIIFDLDKYMKWYESQIAKCRDLDDMQRVTSEHSKLMQILICFKEEE